MKTHFSPGPSLKKTGNSLLCQGQAAFGNRSTVHFDQIDWYNCVCVKEKEKEVNNRRRGLITGEIECLRVTPVLIIRY